MGYLEHCKRRTMYWCAAKAFTFASRLYARAATVLLDYTDVSHGYGEPVYAPVPPKWRAAASDFIGTELATLVEDAREFVFDQDAERQIVANRLARRYDPGAALNEAYQRAASQIAFAQYKLAQDQQDTLAMIESQTASRLPESMQSIELTDKQQAALKFQEKFLRENLQRGAGR